MMKLNFKFKSLMVKLTVYITSIVLVVCVGLGLISYSIASSALTNSVEESLLKITTGGAATVEERLNGYYSQLDALTSNGLFMDYNANKAEIESLLSKLNKQWGYSDLFVADKNGIAIRQNVDISARDYFKKAIAGSNAVSDPVVSKADGTIQIFMAVPIKNENGNVISVLIAGMDGNGLSTIISDITYAKTGKAYMINSKGTVIAHSNKELVLTMDNSIEQAKTDTSLSQIAALEVKMCAGQKGTGEYSYKGVTKYMGYSPIGTTGWSIALAAPNTEVFAEVYSLARMIGIASAIFLALSILDGYIIASGISKPIKAAAGVAETIAKGDFTTIIRDKFLTRKDEIGTLAGAFKVMTQNLNEALNNISLASEQVAGGSKQVSDSSIALSQGATEQASSIEQLTASIEEISSQTKHNANNAKEANELAERAKVNADKGNIRMKEMLRAMDEINNSSSNISKIIKVIDEIAFQTNILALNAAVEAARAGQHGKGFAVVAEEVRNLAARSANAAKETTAMIEGSIQKVEDGTKIANETSEALNAIVQEVDKVSTLVNNIAVSSNEQALGIAQINQGIMQVSAVVQANSATSEESAASSEELSNQAGLLKEQVGMFKLKKKESTLSSYNDLKDIDPDISRMIQGLIDKKMADSSSMDGMFTEAVAPSTKKKIVISDKEFGKY